MPAHCPYCNSVIYSRRNVLCSVCGRRLPERLLFAGREREKVEKEMKELRRRAWLARNEGRGADASDGGMPGFSHSNGGDCGGDGGDGGGD